MQAQAVLVVTRVNTQVGDVDIFTYHGSTMLRDGECQDRYLPHWQGSLLSSIQFENLVLYVRGGASCCLSRYSALLGRIIYMTSRKEHQSQPWVK